MIAIRPFGRDIQTYIYFGARKNNHCTDRFNKDKRKNTEFERGVIQKKH